MGHIKLLRLIDGKSPLPPIYWFICHTVARRILLKPDPLFPPYESLYSTGEALDIPELKNLLSDDILGEWALDAQTIKLLWDAIWQDRPQVVLEFGAGVSTMVLASYALLSSSHAERSCFIATLEQDLKVKENVEERLKESQLERFVKVLHAPLDNHGFYNLDELEVLLTDRCVQWVLIDGPSGPPGCRYEVLPAILKFCCHGARWFLDDAFRDGELQILRRWCNVPSITVDGIYPIGKGLATGYVQ